MAEGEGGEGDVTITIRIKDQTGDEVNYLFNS